LHALHQACDDYVNETGQSMVFRLGQCGWSAAASMRRYG
jgi:hypothetical protein